MKELKHNKTTTVAGRLIHSFQDAAETTLAGATNFNTFFFSLLSRISQPVVFFGLVYWVAAHLAGYSLNILPWWNLAWPLIQALAITTYLAILPSKAIKQYHAGEQFRLALTIISIMLLAVSSMPFVGLGLGNIAALNMIRILALVSILFTEPEPKPFVLSAVYIPTSPEEDEDGYPFARTPVQD